MVFSSIVFMCFFLPAVLVLYCLCPVRLRNALLFVVSLFFYAWGEPIYVLIMLFSTIFDYCNGRALEHVSSPKIRKLILVISVVGNLGILCFFKYTNFILETVGALSGEAMPVLRLALPIGISFYTFQTMSYTIDVYRKKIQAQHNIINFGMYVSMFPQLIAGPIVRYSEVEEQLDKRQLVGKDMAQGMQRFLFGLAKKVLLANQIGALWTEISAQSTLTVAGAWLGAIAFTFQIYFDFSGYSDMAIGLGQIFGFQFPENFAHPYESKSITEFWRRWHMTLSGWFREYLYIPLGGNRLGMKRQLVNLFIVWSLTGLWHGASWNYLIWGIFFFLLLMIEKAFLLQTLKSFQNWVCHVYTMFFVVVGWMIFANESLGSMGKYLLAMFGGNGALCDRTAIYQWYTHLPLLLIMAFGATTLPKRLLEKLWHRMADKEGTVWNRHEEKFVFAAVSIYTLLLLGISLAFLVSGSYNPFLYFRF